MYRVGDRIKRSFTARADMDGVAVAVVVVVVAAVDRGSEGAGVEGEAASCSDSG